MSEPPDDWKSRVESGGTCVEQQARRLDPLPRTLSLERGAAFTIFKPAYETSGLASP